MRAAIDRGYIKNLEDRRGRPARLVLGDPLPDDVEILPSVERLHGCTVAGIQEGVETNFLSETPDLRSQKKFLPTPPMRLQPCNRKTNGGRYERQSFP